MSLFPTPQHVVNRHRRLAAGTDRIGQKAQTRGISHRIDAGCGGLIVGIDRDKTPFCFYLVRQKRKFEPSCPSFMTSRARIATIGDNGS